MRALRRAGYALAGFFLAAVLLWLLFRHANLPRLAAVLQTTRPSWLSLAVFCSFLASGVRALRWWPGLRRRGAVSARAAVNATLIAQFANMALPIRGGPILRGVALARLSPLPLAYAIGASLADRAVDGVTLAFGLLILSVGIAFGDWLPPSAAAGTAAGTMSALATVMFSVGGALATVALGHQNQWLKARLSRRLPSGVAAWGEFSGGVRATMLSRGAVVVWGGAVSTWMIMILGHACVLAALGLPLPFLLPVLTCVMGTVTVVLPGTPGLVGPYHAAIVAAVGLALPDCDTEMALAAALLLHAVHTVPVAILGTIALLTEHQSLWQLDAATTTLETEKEPE